MNRTIAVTKRPATPLRPMTRRRSLRTLLAFFVFAVVLHTGLLLLLDYGPPKFRDPEYGRRLAASLVKQAEAREAGSPFILAIGCSRVAMGVRPDVIPDAPFTLSNLALVGSGPIMEHMAFHRAVEDGLMPDAVLIEFWPPFYREDGGYHEALRFDVNRLRPVDLPMIRDYFPDPDATKQRMIEVRRNPWFSHRESLMQQLMASWLPNNRRNDGVWKDIDEWGWQETKHALHENAREQVFTLTANYYAPLFANYQVSPIADRAMRDLIRDCRKRAIPVALMYMPESTRFRSLMPLAAQKLADDYLKRLVEEMNVPLIDCRGWIDDRELPDGFHMNPDAAAEFTRRLVLEMKRVFPKVVKGRIREGSAKSHGTE